MDGNLSYNANSLQTYDRSTKVGINTNVIDHTSIPEKQMELYGKANANGSAIPTINYPSKKISIAGTIHGSTKANLDSRIDDFKALFNGKDKNLDITYSSSTRRYIATANTISVQRQQKALWATFAIEFTCTNPFGMDTSQTSIMNSVGYTSNSLNVTPTIGGTAPFQLPIFTITVTALTGAGDYVQISNDNNNQQILIYGAGIVNGDVIEIDCEARTVKINGVEINYYGTFLELETGANSITYSDGFTTRTVTITAGYNKRYI